MADWPRTSLIASELYEPGAEVRVEYVDSLGVSGFFDTTILKSNDEQLTLVAPDANMTIRLLIGQSIKIIRILGRDAYVCTVKITGAQRVAPVLIFTTRPSNEEVEKQPRRRFFRVSVSLPFRCTLGEGTVVNASASGFLLQTTKDLFKDGLEFMLSFDIPNRRTDIQARVKVLRRYQEGGYYYTGVDVTSIRPMMQDELIRYLLVRQRETPK